MKSSRSFCNRALLHKNITRFAPVWAIYTVCLFFGILLMADSGLNYYFLSDMGECITIMCCVNLGYAFITAQVLFGDLYTSRMCNALHAMPLRRETYFSTNVLTGFLFSLVPTAVMTLFALALSVPSCIIDGWKIPLLWFAASNLSYLAFFGIAVFCVFLAGNRFAMALCYAIVNFGAGLIYLIVELFHTPLLYGLKTYDTPFLNCMPIAAMLLDGEYIDFTHYFPEVGFDYGVFELGSWNVLFIYAAIGIVLLIAGLMLYRRRKLECAGDFLAMRAIEPVFATIFSLAIGVACYGVCIMFTGVSSELLYIVYLVVGMVIGFFVAQMLLKRTVRVFSRRAFAGCAVLLVCFGLSIALTEADPLGIETKIPDADDIESVVLFTWHRSNPENISDQPTFGGSKAIATDEKDISRVMRLHSLALKELVGERFASNSIGGVIYDYNYTGQPRRTTAYTISYRLKDGTVLNRYYYAYIDSEAGNILKMLFSTPQCVLGIKSEEIDVFTQRINSLDIGGEVYPLNDETADSLVSALWRDCEEGNLVQEWVFHNDEEECGYYTALNIGVYPTKSEEGIATEAYTGFHSDAAGIEFLSLDLFTCCENTIEWLRENFPKAIEVIEEESGIYE